MAYIMRNVYAALLEGGSKPSFVPYKPRYSPRQRLMILLEMTWIIALQVAVFQFIGYDWLRFMIISPLALIIASGIAMSYITTHHFLSPYCEHTDPVIGSLSIIVPKWVDLIHDNFSYHTEHHLFPAMNPRYYPMVSLLLIQHFPDRYRRITFNEAWDRLWQKEQYLN
jgi:fatty acid desaturase